MCRSEVEQREIAFYFDLLILSCRDLSAPGQSLFRYRVSCIASYKRQHQVASRLKLY
jgi:hypothetical protein